MFTQQSAFRVSRRVGANSVVRLAKNGPHITFLWHFLPFEGLPGTYKFHGTREPIATVASEDDGR